MESKSSVSVRFLSSVTLVGLFLAPVLGKAQSVPGGIDPSSREVIRNNCERLSQNYQARVTEIRSRMRALQPEIIHEVELAQQPYLTLARSFWSQQQRLLTQIARQTLPILTDSEFQQGIVSQRAAIEAVSEHWRTYSDDVGGPSRFDLERLRSSFQEQLITSIRQFRARHEGPTLAATFAILRDRDIEYIPLYLGGPEEVSLRSINNRTTQTFIPDPRGSRARSVRPYVYKPFKITFDITVPSVTVCSERFFSAGGPSLCSQVNPASLASTEAALASNSSPSDEDLRSALSLDFPRLDNNGNFMDHSIVLGCGFDFFRTYTGIIRFRVEYCHLEENLGRLRSESESQLRACSAMGWRPGSSSVAPVTTPAPESHGTEADRAVSTDASTQMESPVDASSTESPTQTVNTP